MTECHHLAKFSGLHCPECAANSVADIPRYFYVEARVPRGMVYCGKLYETEATIRAAFQGCTIDPNGVVHVYRGPRDTRNTFANHRWLD